MVCAMASHREEFSARRRRIGRVIVPHFDRVRSLKGTAFGWIDARLHHDGWMRALTPEALAIYAFLCIAADRHGVSFYRRDRMARELGLDDGDVATALTRLRELDLVAYEPFRQCAVDGFHQVLSLPDGGPGPALSDDELPLERLTAKWRIRQ